MFGCSLTAVILGVRMQAAQSSVGKVLSNMAMWPPMLRLAFDQDHLLAGVGQRQGGLDAGDAAADDQGPGHDLHELPLQRLVAGDAADGRGQVGLGLVEARPGLSSVTQATCSRMLAICTRKRFRPASSAARRNVGSCRFGEQAATTMRFRLSSRMSRLTSSWPGSEHMYL